MCPASAYGVCGPPVHYKWCSDHQLPAATSVDASVVADGVAEILSPTRSEPPVDLTAQTELQEGIASAGSETEQREHGRGPAKQPNFITVVDGVALGGATANVQPDISHPRLWTVRLLALTLRVQPWSLQPRLWSRQKQQELYCCVF